MINEKQSLAPNTDFFRWKPAAWLRVSGADAFTFLQGQFTNDLRELERVSAVYGLWLNTKGKVLADSFVGRGAAPGEFWVGSYHSPAEVIRARLEAFIIADDVVVEDVTEVWGAVSLGEGDAMSDGTGVRFEGRRSAGRVVEWVFPLDHGPEVLRLLENRRELSGTEMERRRILAGIPKIPQDIGPGELPNEGGLEAAAISYTKGCYLGQEVMARLKSMGTVRRRLRRVKARGAVPALPCELFQADRRVGELRSVASVDEGYAGLGLLSLINLRTDEPMSFTAGGDAVVELDAP